MRELIVARAALLVLLLASSGACAEPMRDEDRCARAMKQTIPHWEEYALQVVERAGAARRRARTSEGAMLEALEAQADVSLVRLALDAARRVELEARLAEKEEISPSLKDASRHASEVFTRVLEDLTDAPEPLRRTADAATGWCR